MLRARCRPQLFLSHPYSIQYAKNIVSNIPYHRDLEDQLASEVRAEATILAGVQHLNVCIFMGACMAPPNRALVMEFVSPGSLWEALREGSIPSVRIDVCIENIHTPLFYNIAFSSKQNRFDYRGMPVQNLAVHLSLKRSTTINIAVWLLFHCTYS